MILQWISLFQNSLEYKHADRREKQEDKEIREKEETVNKSVLIHLTMW